MEQKSKSDFARAIEWGFGLMSAYVVVTVILPLFIILVLCAGCCFCGSMQEVLMKAGG